MTRHAHRGLCVLLLCLCIEVVDCGVVTHYALDGDMTDSGTAGNTGGALTGTYLSTDVVCGSNSLHVGVNELKALPKPSKGIPLGSSSWGIGVYVKMVQPGFRVLFHFGSDDRNANPSGGVGLMVKADESLGVYTYSTNPTSSTKLVLNVWTHVAATYDGTELVLYVDGLEVMRKTLAMNIVADSSYGGIILGERHRGGTRAARAGEYLLDEAVLSDTSDLNELVATCRPKYTQAPDTPSPPTPAPDTPVPPTPAPPTPAPPTAVPTVAPPTQAPPTPAPPTPAPPTPAPPTPAPPTPAPPTAVPTVAPPTQAPPTPAPPTLAPPTPAPPTPAPPTPAPPTPAPPTPAPPTPAPPTPAPDTPAPPTPAPPTPAPPTPAPPTPAPPTPAPPTPAPPTPAPPTLAPPTPAPPTVAPPTPAPPTLAPPTPAPPTPAPPTPAPPTFAPPTPAPATPSPPTASPPTQAPATDPPSTSAPPTPSPDTGAPLTWVPDTAAPPTPFPDTGAPPTPVPRVEGKGVTRLEIVGERKIESVEIQKEGGDTVVARLVGGTVLRWRERYLVVLVRWPGGMALNDADGNSNINNNNNNDSRSNEVLACNGGPCVVVETDRSPTESKFGLAATMLADPGSVTAELTTSDADLVAQLGGGKDAVSLVFRNSDFRSYSPNSETLKISFSGDLFVDATLEELCLQNPSEANGVSCSCPPPPLSPSSSPSTRSFCKVDVRLQSQQPEMPNTEMQKTVSSVGVAAVLATSVVVPVSPTAGGALVKMSMLTMTMYCPSDGPTKMDQTLNPLGLRFGDEHNEQVNGALVGNVLLQSVFMCLGGIAMGVFYWKEVAKKKSNNNNNNNNNQEGAVEWEEELRNEHGTHLERYGLTWTYLLARAHFGWLMIPATFLYGGAVLSCFAAILYSATSYKVVAMFVLLVFGMGFPLYTWRYSRMAPAHARVVRCEGRQPLLRKVFWGREEWVGNDAHGDESWLEVHRFTYDAYKQTDRYFLTFEVVMTLVLGLMEAVEPTTLHQCKVRAGAIAAIIGLTFLVLVIRRPYLAPYETATETAIAGLELVMTAFIIVALGEEKPSEHWSASAAGTLGILAMYLILLKFLVDVVIFIIDEHNAFTDIGANGSFLIHLLCCGNSLKNDAPTWTAFTKTVEEAEILSLELSSPAQAPLSPGRPVTKAASVNEAPVPPNPYIRKVASHPAMSSLQGHAESLHNPLIQTVRV